MGGTRRTTSSAKLVRFRKPKIACSPSYVDYKPKINAVILLDMGRILRGDCMGGIRKGKKTKNFSVADVLTVE
jgi:hypothetical protein